MEACDFCNKKTKRNEVSKVKELVFYRDLGIIRFSDILSDIFNLEINATTICAQCLELINSQYQFKQQVRKNLKLPAVHNSRVISEVNNFLSKTKETTKIESHHGILCVIPESKRKLFNNIQKFSPAISLEIDEKLKAKAELVARKINHPVHNDESEIVTPHTKVQDIEDHSSDSLSDEYSPAAAKKQKFTKKKRGRPSKSKVGKTNKIKKQNAMNNHTIVSENSALTNAILPD